MLTFLEALILGIIQGIAEWLPVSSEGMTSLVMINFFGKSFAEALPISIWLHVGTMLAAVVFLRKDIIGILKHLPRYVTDLSSKTPVNRTTTFLVVSTVLTGIVGFPLILFAVGFTDFSGKAATAFIGAFLVFTGFLQMKAAGKGRKSRGVGITDALITGAAQGLSALPGISRSGITVSALLLRKFDAEKALRLSFLMSIPAVFAAEIGLVLMDMITFDINSLAAIASSFVFGLLTISLLFKVAKRINFSWFCIILGILSIAVFFI